MMHKKLGIILALLLCLSLLAAPLASADYRAPALTDSPDEVTEPQAQPEASHRLIVELERAPLAVLGRTQPGVMAAGGKLDVNTRAAQDYITILKADQERFTASLMRAIPTARVAGYIDETGERATLDYQITFNGLTVETGPLDRDAARRAIAKLPGVKAVYLDLAQHSDLYTSTTLINAPAIWNAVGSQWNGGTGVKVASMDGGIHHAAPMFSGDGWEYPAGWPAGGLGDPLNNNGKIIASRVYFRDWDPPAPGDENSWPGELGTEHGNHTSSIAAGNVVTATYGGLTFTNMSGVAPGAWLMSYRVFYYSVTGDGSFYNAEGIAALEDIVADGADVLNCSWGGGPTSVGGEFDALDTALINATKAGIFVSMSNGNAGPFPATGDHPSDEYINVAATTTDGTLASGRVSVTAPEPVTDSVLIDMAFADAAFGAVPTPGTLLTFSYLPSAVVSPTNTNGCNPWPAGTFTGKAALIARGDCEFGVKVLNAEQAGAEFVVVYNNAGDELINMGAGAVGGQVTIPSIFIGQTHGEHMAAWYGYYPGLAEFTYDAHAFQAGNTPDIVATFSSRGPGVGSVLKPDIAAPGVNILAQGYTPGATGEDRHLGWGQASGTSMAAPHVAGAAALLKQVHPDWSNAWIKSALMSTSKYTDVYAVDIWGNVVPAQPLDMGAGRLDLTNAADPGVILEPASLSFGLMGEAYATTKTISVTITSVADAVETYTIGMLYTGGVPDQLTQPGGFDLSTNQIVLAPGESTVLEVTFDATVGNPGDNQDYVVLDGETHDAHMPAWARVVVPQSADVLIIQNDASYTVGMPDYTSYYTSTLDALGITYEVWNADAYFGNPYTIPTAEWLYGYKAIIYFTGDNYFPDGYFTVSTPLTFFDQDILTDYVNAGGKLIAMGQDMAWVMNATASWNSFMYSFVFGGYYLQDSLTAYELPAQPVVALPGAPAAFQGVSLDIGYPGEMGDGAGNQYYVDEIDDRPDDATPPPYTKEYQALLALPTQYMLEEGTVAMAHRDQPSLERPGISYLGRSVYTSFGLEGVNNPAMFVRVQNGTSSREGLLELFLNMVWDEPSAELMKLGSSESSKLTIFEAGFDSNIDSAYPVSYRWDFGDGSAYLGPISSPEVSHRFQSCGLHTVRVEITDNYGNVTIGTQEVDITTCYGTVLYLPLVTSAEVMPTLP